MFPFFLLLSVCFFLFFYEFHYPLSSNPSFSTHTFNTFCVPPHSQRRTEMSSSPMGLSCPPSRPPPWAAGSQVFPRVSGWGSDNPSLVHTVIAQGRLSTLFPCRRWEKRASGEMQTPPGNPDATRTKILLPGSILSCQQRLGSQSRRIITLNSHSFGLLCGLTSEHVFFSSHELGKRVPFFRRGATNTLLVALGWKLLLPPSDFFWYLHPLLIICSLTHPSICIPAFRAVGGAGVSAGNGKSTHIQYPRENIEICVQTLGKIKPLNNFWKVLKCICKKETFFSTNGTMLL